MTAGPGDPSRGDPSEAGPRHRGAPPAPVDDAVERGDLDELVRLVGRLCLDEDWAGLVELRDRCRRAFERGRQLWPAASHAEYRLALEAPGPWAASVLVPGAGHFALGPLPEVAASSHEWGELAPHLPPTPEAALFAHERVVTGEDLGGAEVMHADVVEVPLRLQPWEPAYPVAAYAAQEARFPDPPMPPLDAVPLGPPGVPVDDPAGSRALAELAATWKRESNGTVDVVAVAGGVTEAVAALVARSETQVGETRLGEIGREQAMAAMAWTAASGGAHGRRAGMAAGRFSAWWTVAALARLHRWPLDPDEVGRAATDLRWYRWAVGSPPLGWSLRLAVEDPRRGRAWAVRADDVAEGSGRDRAAGRERARDGSVGADRRPEGHERQ